MTAGTETMSEPPIFSCKAHVFHIDPKTKRSWMSASTAAVSVAFFFDSSRNLYRIISVEGSKAVINSTITANMTFTKTSQKFGQWSDLRANTVYGLGFASEGELSKFIEKFQEVKEAIQAAGGGAAGQGNAAPPVTCTVPAPNTGTITPGPAASPLPANRQDNSEPMGYATVGRRTTNYSPGGPGEPTMDNEQQLRHENERLKLALAQSSGNAKKWEVELATLKSNNLRLTQALQESTSNVEEWKRQLQVYREEVAKAKTNAKGVMESSNGGVVNSGETEVLRARIQQLELDLARMSHNQEEKSKSAIDVAEMEKTLAVHESQKQVIHTLTDQLATQIAELTNIHRELTAALSDS